MPSGNNRFKELAGKEIEAGIVFAILIVVNRFCLPLITLNETAGSLPKGIRAVSRSDAQSVCR
jgi:hypothetical protein